MLSLRPAGKLALAGQCSLYKRYHCKFSLKKFRMLYNSNTEHGKLKVTYGGFSFSTIVAKSTPLRIFVIQITVLLSSVNEKLMLAKLMTEV